MSLLSSFLSFIPGFRTVDGGDCANLASLMLANNFNITALAGNVQPPVKPGSQTPGSPNLVYGLNEIRKVVTNLDSVQLPPAVGGGRAVVINNDAANTATVWACPVGADGTADKIVPHNDVKANAVTSVACASAATIEFYCYQNGFWKASLTT